jgi:mediator of RNA polymerase II transcription subunit 21
MDPDIIAKEGFLEKLGVKGIINTYAKRYFRLKGGRLFYFENDRDKDSIGFIDVESATKIDVDPKEKYGFVIDDPNKRQVKLRAPNFDVQQSWIEMLRRYCKAYTKTAELQTAEAENRRLSVTADTLAQTNEFLQLELASHQEQLKVIRVQLQQAQSTNATLVQQLSAAETMNKSIQNLSAKIDESKPLETVDTFEAQYREAFIAQKTAENALQAANQDKEKLEDEKKQLDLDRKNWENKATAYASQLIMLKSMVEERVSAVEKSLAEKVTENEALKVELAATKEKADESNQIRAQLELLKQQNAELSERVGSAAQASTAKEFLEKDLERSTQASQELSSQFSALQIAHDSLKMEYAQSQIDFKAQIDALQESLSSAQQSQQASASELLLAVAQHKEQADELEQVKSALEARNTDFSVLQTSLGASSEQQALEADRLSKRVADLEVQLEESQTKSAALQSEIEALNASLASHQADAIQKSESQDAIIAELQKESKDLTERLEQEKKSKSDLSALLDSNDTASASLASQMEEMRTANASLQSSLETALAAHATEIGTLRSSSTAELASLRETNTQLTDQVIELEKTSSELTEQLQNEKTAHLALQSFGASQSASTESQIQELTDKNTQLQTQLAEASQALNIEVQAKSELESLLSAKESELNVSKEKLEELSSEYLVSQAKVTELDTKIAGLQNQSGSDASALTSLTTDLNNSRNQVEELLAQRDTLTQQLEAAQRTSFELSEKMIAHEVSLESLTAQLQQLASENASMLERLQQGDAALTEAHNRLEQGSAGFAALQRDSHAVVAGLEAKVLALTSAGEEERHLRKTAEKDASELLARSNGLYSELEQVNAILSKTTSDLNAKREESARLTQMLSQADQEKQKLLAQLTAVESTLALASSQSSEDRAKLQQQVTQITVERETAKQELLNLRETAVAAATQAASELTQAQHALSNATRALDETKAELSATETKLRQAEENARSEAHQSHLQVEALMADVKAKDAQLAEVKATQASTQAQLNENVKTLDEVRTLFESLKDALPVAQAEAEQRQHALNTLSEELIVLKSEKAKLEEQLKFAAQSAAAQSEALEQTQHALRTKEDELGAIITQSKASEAALAAAVADLNQQLEASRQNELLAKKTIVEMQEKSGQLAAELDEKSKTFVSELSVLVAASKNGESQSALIITQLEQTNQQLSNDLRVKEENHAEALAVLTQQLDASKTAEHSLSQQISQLKGDLESSVKIQDENTVSLETLRTAHAEALNALSALDSQSKASLENFEQTMATIKAESAQEKEDLLQRLSVAIESESTLKTDLQALKDQIQGLEQTSSQTAAQIAQEKEDLLQRLSVAVESESALKSDLQALKDQIQGLELSSSSASAASAQEKEDLLQRLSAAVDSESALKSDLQVVKDQIQGLKQTLSAASAASAQEKEDLLQRLSAAVESESSLRTSYEAEKVHFKQEMDAAVADKEALSASSQKHLSDLQKQLDEKHQELDTAKSHLQASADALTTSLTNEISVLKTRLSEAQDASQQLSQQYQTTLEALNSANSALSEEKAKVQVLETQFSEHSSNLAAEHSAALSALESSSSQLQAQLQAQLEAQQAKNEADRLVLQNRVSQLSLSLEASEVHNLGVAEKQSAWEMLEQSLKSKVDSLSTQCAELNQKHEETLSVAKETEDRLKEELAKQKEELTLAQEKSAEWAAEAARLEATLQKVSLDSKAEILAYHNQVDHLQTQLTASREEMQLVLDRHAHTLNEAASSGVSEAVVNLQKQLEASAIEMAEIQKNHRLASDEHLQALSASQQLSHDQSTAIQRMQDENKQLSRKLEEEMAAHASTTQELAHMFTELDRSKNQFNALQTHVDAQKAALEASHLEKQLALTQQLEDLRAAHERHLQNGVQHAGLDAEAEVGQLAVAGGHAAPATVDEEKLAAERAALQEERLAFEQELATFQSELDEEKAELESQYEQLEREKKILASEREALSAEREALESERSIGLQQNEQMSPVEDLSLSEARATSSESRGEVHHHVTHQTVVEGVSQERAMLMAEELKEQAKRHAEMWDSNLKLREVVEVLQGRQRSLETQLESLREELALKNTQFAKIAAELKDHKKGVLQASQQTLPAALHRLQQELEAARMAADAHQTQNAFLAKTIQQLVDDKAIEVKAKAAKAQHLRDELELRRQEILELRSAVFKGSAPQLTAEYIQEMDSLQREYFFTLALGIKLSRMIQGQSTNLDVAKLWDQARHLHFSEWNRYIVLQAKELLPQSDDAADPTAGAFTSSSSSPGTPSSSLKFRKEIV